MRNITAVAAHTPEPALLAVLAKHLAIAGGEGLSRVESALAIGEERGAPARVQAHLKAVLAAGTSDDPALNGLADARIITTAFTTSLRNRSIFYRLMDGLLIRVPLRTRLSFTTANASAFLVGEGAATPVARMSLEGTMLDPVKAAGIIIFTDEMLRSAGTAGETMLTRELRRVTIAAVDEIFLDVVTDGDTPTIASTGNTAVDAAADLRALFAAVALTAESAPLLAVAPDAALAASTMLTTGGGFLFPEMAPTGGRMLGVEAIVSDQVAAGRIVLIDGAGIAGETDAVTVEASNQASIEMRDDPVANGITPTATTSVSMFQTNSTAILVKAYFGAERFRDNAVAILTGVSWGEA